MAMHPRVLLLSLGGGLLGATVAFVACSSGPSTQPTPGIDGGQPDVISVFETSSPDTFVAPGIDAGMDSGAHVDASIDAHPVTDASVDAHPIDTGALAMCSIITGACDIVSQNCSNGSECVAIYGPDGGIVTQCVADTPTEVLPKGAPCCPASDGTNPCLPGLECNGGGLCTGDGGVSHGLPNGWGGSRCTPHCCITDGGSELSNCGSAPDGGPQGSCDLSTSEYNICSYPTGCVPLRGAECITGFGCEISGDAAPGCNVLYLPDGGTGVPSGGSCLYANSCADGLACIGSGATGTCSWMCHVAGGVTPFDAGLLTATPGYGGCPTGQTCDGIIGFPSWLGACIAGQ